jgi:acyl dehydratase
MDSLFFEDFAVGMEFRTCMSEPFTSTCVDEYLRLTGDLFYVHSDDAFARRFGLSRAMVPGNFVIARATGLVFEHGHMRQSLLVQAKKHTTFISPLYLGEALFVSDLVTAVEDRPGKHYGRVVLQRLTFNHRGKLIQSAEQDNRVLLRDMRSSGTPDSERAAVDGRARVSTWSGQ